MNLIDATKTQAVLIGISQYKADNSLHELPAAQTNVEKLQNVLASSTVGIAKENITTLVNAEQPQDILKAIKTASQQAQKSLIIYYSGHGILDDEFNLFLSASESKVEDISFTGVSIEAIDKVIQKEKLLVVFIIDACFSEKAFDQFRKTNFYVLASSRKNTPSKYPPNEQYSAFTNELTQILEKGIGIRKAELSLRDIYLQLEKNLTKQDYPQPRQVNTNLVQELIFAKNNANTVTPSTQLNKHIILPVYYAVAKQRKLTVGGLADDGLEIDNPFADDELSAYFEESDNDQHHDENLQLTQYANQIIRYFPMMVAEELKRLFVPAPSEQQRNLGRINQIFRVYFALMRYLAYVLLAQLWDEKIKQDFKLSVSFQDLMKEFAQPAPLWFLQISKETITILTNEKRKLFVDGLATWRSELNKAQYETAYEFIEYLYANFRKNAATWSETDIEQICEQTEKQLTTVLEQLAFLAKYELISIRAIRVIKLKNIKADFIHSLNHLYTDTNQSGQLKKEIQNFYTDSHSICLTKQTNLEGEILNLSPLFFDKNTYSQNIPSIYFYDRKDTTEHSFLFRPISFSRDVPAEDLASKNGDIRLLAQFEKFLEVLS